VARVLVARELSTTQLIAMRDDVKAKLLAFAAKETGKPASDFVVRDAMPLTDFGFATEKWCNQLGAGIATATWTKDWTKELPKTKFVAFYGFIDHADSPVLLGAKFKVGANGQTTRDVVMFGRMRVEDVVKCYHEPVLYKGQETIYLELYQASGSTLAQYAEELEMMCLVAEPYGEVISAPVK